MDRCMKWKKRRRIFLLLLLLSSIVILIGSQNQSTTAFQHLHMMNNMMRSVSDITTVFNSTNVLPKRISSTQIPKENVKYDLLINSYMNSGSRFTGQLFGFRTGAFYIYEPLWKFSVWDYYHGDNLICSSTQGSINCSKGSVAKVNRQGKLQLVKDVAQNISIVEMMLGVLDDMYSCNFSRVENLFVSNVQYHQELAGPKWNAYRTCTKSRLTNKMACLKKEEQRCKNASHVITKVLRLTMGSYEKLLEKKKNLKLVHLFRNPFAIINSRTESKGYPVKDFSSNAAVLCKKMLLDYEGGVRLAKKFPNRVKFVFYEDIKSNVTEKMEKLYRYIGMESNTDEMRKLNRVTTNKGVSRTPGMSKTRAADNAHWWRSHMSFLRYQGVKVKCTKLMEIFNLTDFKDRESLLKINIPEMNLPDIFRIL